MTLRHGVDTDWRRKWRSSSSSAARVAGSIDRACHAERRLVRFVSPSDWATASLARERNIPDFITLPAPFHIPFAMRDRGEGAGRIERPSTHRPNLVSLAVCVSITFHDIDNRDGALGAPKPATANTA